MGHTPATIFLLTICLFESSSAAGVRGITTRRLQNEPAFIHKGCSEKKGLRPEYTEHGMFGRGWYCSDGKMCGDGQNFEHTCDHAQIHRGCRHLVGLKPKYDHSTHTWYCSDRHHGHHQQHGFVEIDSYAQQCVRDRHPLWHRHGHSHGFVRWWRSPVCMLSELLRRAQQRRCVRQRLRRERVRRVVRERVVNVWRPSPSPLMKKYLQLLRKKHFGSGGAQAARIAC